MKTRLNYIMLALPFALLSLTSCATLNQESYDTLMSLPPKVDALEKKVASIETPASAQKQQTKAETTTKPTPPVDKAAALKKQMQQAMGTQDVNIQATTPRTVHITLQHRILFASGSASLSSSGEAFLDKFSRVAENLPEDAHIRIVGHSDNRQLSWKTRQKFKNNQVLSQARAEAVKTWLSLHSRIKSHMLFAEGRGASEPIGNNGTKDGRALNRRIEIFVENI